MLFVLPGMAASQSREVVRDTIQRTEDVLDDLDDDFKDGLDKTPLDDTQRAKYLAQRMEDLEDSFDVIRKRFDNGADYHEMRGLIGGALDIASELDPVVRRYSFSNDTERDWSEVAANLDSLARHYQLAELTSFPRAPRLP